MLLYTGMIGKNFLGKCRETKCLEMFNEYAINDDPSDQLIYTTLVNMEEKHDDESPPFDIKIRTILHPDLMGIDFRMPTDECVGVLFDEGTSSGLPKMNCDILSTNILSLVNKMCADD